MFTDMVGFSARTQKDEGAALEDLERHNALLRPIFRKHRGREVKTAGDSFLVEFESALEAGRCALELQQTLHDRNAALATGRPFEVRVGIHVGDVEESSGDLLGDAVNIAARIEPLADPGGVCLTQQVLDQIQNKLALTVVRLPRTPLKNIETPLVVYRVVLPWEHPPPRERSAAPEGRSLAVLPLANISPDPQDEYFADGLTEEIISTLSQVPGLRVIARTSVMPYKSAPKPISEIGAELGVDTVLEGSVRKAGNRLRITLQLLDVSSQHHRWASTYNREVDDIFAVQTDIAERTAEALKMQLGGTVPETASRRPTPNPRAYDAYLRGLVASGESEARGYERAVRHFEEATRLDPTFAEAYAAWADLYVTLAADYLPVREVLPKAKELARRALELDPESSDAHVALGNIALQFDHDWKTAEAEFQRAISLNPSNAVGLRFYGMLLRVLGRFEEAKEMARRALRIDPVSAIQASLAWTELESGNFEAAISYAESERDKDPSAEAPHVYLGLTYLAAGQREGARREADVRLTNPGYLLRFDHALLNACLGRPEMARAIVAEAEAGRAESHTSFCDLAMIYSALGEKEKALALLERDYREGDQSLWLYYRSVFFDSIRDDPRFVSLVERFHLPEVPIFRGAS